MIKIYKPWFKQVRGSYLPCSWQGWLTYAPYVYWFATTFNYVDNRSHSASDTLIGIVPYWVCGAVVMHWVAKATSNK